MVAMEETCFFKDTYKCHNNKDRLSKSKRIQTVASASQERGDGFSKLLPEISDGSYIMCHKNCISRYVSPASLSSFKKRQSEQPSTSTSQAENKGLRSSVVGGVFDFREHCLFCIDVTPCSPEGEDSRVPSRYRQSVSLVRTDKLADGQDFKNKLLNVCDERNDQLADVRERIIGAGVSDLHALDARYHRRCSKQFYKIPKSTRDGSFQSSEEQALLDTFETIGADPGVIWTSIDIEALYVDNGGSECSRRTLVRKVSDYFGEAILVLQSPGIATLLIFRQHAAKTIKLIDDDTDDDIELCKQKVA